jgi:hypothetical protein
MTNFPEPDLTDAANNCYIDLYPTYLQSTFDASKSTKTTVLAFCSVLKTEFPPDQQTAFPVIDLLAVLAAQATLLPDPAGSDYPNLADFQAIIFTLYKLLFLSVILSNQTPQQITTAQAAAILAAYNTSFDI